MAFTTYAALRTALLDALADHLASGLALTGQIQFRDRLISYKSPADIEKLVAMTYRLEALETKPTAAQKISYGKFRRYPE